MKYKLTAKIVEFSTGKMYYRVMNLATGLIVETTEGNLIKAHKHEIDMSDFHRISVWDKKVCNTLIVGLNDLETWCRMHIRSYK